MTDTAAPGTRSSTTRSSTVVAWILYVPMVLLDLALSGLAITAVFMTDSCGSADPEPMVCDMGYFGGVMFAFWGTLVALIVAVPIAVVVAGRRGNRAWKWPLLGIAASIIASVLFVTLMTR